MSSEVNFFSLFQTPLVCVKNKLTNKQKTKREHIVVIATEEIIKLNPKINLGFDMIDFFIMDKQWVVVSYCLGVQHHLLNRLDGYLHFVMLRPVRVSELDYWIVCAFFHWHPVVDY